MKFFVVEPCASANAYEIKLRDRKLDLKRAEKALESLGTVAAATPVVIIARIDDYSVSVYASGRLMVKGEKRLKSKDVNELADKIMSAFDKNGAVV
jgi:ribonuclease HIII